MFHDAFTAVGKLIAEIGLGGHVDENTAASTAAGTTGSSAANADHDRDDQVKNDNDSSSETETRRTNEEVNQVGLLNPSESSDTEFEAAALQLPSINNANRVNTWSAADAATATGSGAQESMQDSVTLQLPLQLTLTSVPREQLYSDHVYDAGLARNYSEPSSSTPPPNRLPSRHHPHRRTSSNAETSFSNISSATEDHLHASWTNVTSDPDDPLSFITAAAFTGTNNSMAVSRPLPVSRLSSNASTTSGPTLMSSNSFTGDDSFHSMGIFSAIHDAARITNWETVKELCIHDPEAAKFVGKDRWTALHHACNRRCPKPDVVEALIRANPDALLLEEEKGWYPLHYACRFKAPTEVVRLIVHLFPDKGKKAVQKQDKQGRTPLYYAVRYDAPAGVVGILINVDASVVLEEDQNSDSPLGLVWDSWAEKLEGKRTLQRLIRTAKEEESAHERALRVQKLLQTQSKVVEKWNNVNMFLKAAFGFSVDDEYGTKETSDERGNEEEEKKDATHLVSQVSTDNRKWRILHAAAAIKCHYSLFQLACALHPEQASEWDENDLQGPRNIRGGWQTATHLSALHLAASSVANGDTGKAVIQNLLCLNSMAAEVEDSTGSLPLHRIAENTAKSDWIRDGARLIYEAHTAAVRVSDSVGRLPLHRAATAVVPQGEVTNETTVERSIICNLLELYPDASSHADNFGRLPLHFAVQYGTTWDIQLQFLHDQFPQAVRSRTGVKLGNMLPLHMASSNSSAELSLIKKLVELHPRAASQAHRDGKLPLHFACETGLSWESVKVIIDANPAAVRQTEQNSRGWSVLHMAGASKLANREFIHNLLQLNPEAAQVADGQGRFPLHLAIISGKSWDGGLSDLFVANPDAIGAADGLGLLPFFLGCFRYCGTSSRSSSDETTNSSANSIDALKTHHRRHSSRVSFEAIQREQSQEAEEARQLDVLFNLLRADPTVIA